jgi:hypothetical protein
MENFEKFDQIERVMAMFSFDVNDYNQDKSFTQINPALVKQSYKKLGEMWNKNEKSRNFCKHIISAFITINNWNKVLNFEGEKFDEFGKITNKNFLYQVDAILGIKLAGITRISHGITKISMHKMFLDAKCITEKRNVYTKGEQEELDRLIANLPIEVRKGTFAYFSEKSTKYICNETSIALRLFTTNMLLLDNKEINFLIKKTRIGQINNDLPKENKLTNSEINLMSKVTTYGIPKKSENALSNNLSEKSLQILNKLKSSLSE